MSDYNFDYWHEALSASLEDKGLLIAVTSEQLKDMAKDLMNAYENIGMAFGHDCIPDPKIAEIAGIKKNYEAKIKELEQREYNYRKSVATRRNVNIEAVYMDRDGSVMIDQKLA